MTLQSTRVILMLLIIVLLGCIWAFVDFAFAQTPVVLMREEFTIPTDIQHDVYILQK